MQMDMEDNYILFTSYVVVSQSVGLIMTVLQILEGTVDNDSLERIRPVMSLK
jgi:hypothetical protein